MLRIRGSWKKQGETKQNTNNSVQWDFEIHPLAMFFFWGVGSFISHFPVVFSCAASLFSCYFLFFPRSSYRFLKGSMEPITIAKRSLKPKISPVPLPEKKWWCRFSFFIISLMASGHTMFVVGILFTGLVRLLLLSQIWVRFSDLFPSTKKFRLSACFGLSQSCWPSVDCFRSVFWI